jgi:trehalose 6-phosphate phosphatase
MQAERASKIDEKGSAVVASVMQILEPLFATRNLFIGLDRDGTIVPYADRPEDATVDPELAELLDSLSKKPGIKVGIISARSIAQLRSDFDAKKLFLAGNYGMEISSPQGDVFIQPFALAAVPTLKEVRDRLTALVTPETGAILEDHGYSLCLHWQLVPEDRRPELKAAFDSLKSAFPSLLFTPLLTSYEVKPLTTWSKGEALNQIFNTYQQMLNNSFVLYAGDSAADEPAFSWVNGRGGLSIKAGAGDFESCSKFQISDLKVVRALLRAIVALER